MKRLRVAFILSVSAVLAACAGQTATPGDKAPYIQSQKQEARKLQQQGELARALAYWRSTLPMGKPDEETRKAIAALEKEIRQKVAALEKKARRAYQAGKTRTGDTTALKILALQPGNAQAREWLVASTTTKARAQARDKAQQEYPASEQPAVTTRQPMPESSTPDNAQNELETLLAAKEYAKIIDLAQQANFDMSPRNAGLLRSAHIGLGENAIEAGNPVAGIEHFRAAIQTLPQRGDPLVNRIRTLQQESSDAWYREGRKILNTDIDAAISAFTKALEIKPDHAAAKSALSRAKTLKRNLEKIENR